MDANNENGKINKFREKVQQWMNKIDIIARRILGWKLNSWNKWYDFEKEFFIHDEKFQPEQNLDHAILLDRKSWFLIY